MIKHELIPCTEKTAFWAIGCYEHGAREVWHIALIDVLSGHTLWRVTTHCPLDPERLAEVITRFRGEGWTIEPLA